MSQAEPRAVAELPRSDGAVAARNAVRLAASLMGTWAVALLVRLHLPRHLGPVRFGELNFSDSFAGSFCVLLSLGIDTYLQKEVPVRPRHASDFFGSVIVLRGLMLLLLTLGMTGWLRATNHPPAVIVLVSLFSVTYFVLILNASYAAMLQASSEVRALAAQNVISKLIWGGGIAICIALNAPLVVFVVPQLLAELIKALVLHRAARRAIQLQLRLDSAMLKGVVVAGLPFYVNAVAQDLVSRLGVTLTGMLSSPREVGWYSAASNFATLALLLSPLVYWVLMPLFARAAHRSQDEFYSILRRAFEGLMVVAIPVGLLISLGAEFWIALVFGPSFAPAALALRLLGIVFVATYVTMLLSCALVILNQGWRLTAILLSGLALQFATIWLLVPRLAPLREGAAGAAAALGVGAMECFVAACLLYLLGRRSIDARSGYVIAASCVSAGIVVALHRVLEPFGPWRLAIDMAAYLALAIVLRAIRFSEVLAAAKLILRRPAAS